MNIKDRKTFANFLSLRPSPSTGWDPRAQKIGKGFAFLIVIILFLVGYHLLTAVNFNNIKYVQIAGQNIKVDLALTPVEQEQGLSGRQSLAENEGMLFVFDHSSNWGIWMKDMNFPIDVLWISGDLKVSDIVENMLPSSYPYVYTSHIPTQYVLEVPAGTVKRSGIAVGQSVVFK